ncbi:MAG TPA: tRNA lysidine(34) synthetase TilS [Acidimicrobiales bacterium]|nr:tRNA lysidine(34) synthetase TilS [Acidimicrobiales bacterium]
MARLRVVTGTSRRELERQAAPLLERCDFPPAGELLHCAVSGGSDSLALLALAVAAGCEAVACHVDHGLRPGSELEAGVVAQAATRLGCEVRRMEARVVPGPNLEARAREARRAALPPGSATGHTADDQAETVLYRLLRGSGLDGLVAMRPGPEHPILRLRRDEAATFVASLGLEVVHDASNEDPRYVRNRLRHELLPLCSDVAGRDVVPLLARCAELLAADADGLERLAAGLDPSDARALSEAPVALARRSLRRWLRAGRPGEYPPGSAAIERVLQVAAGKARACELEGGRRVRRSRGRLLLEEPSPPPAPGAASPPGVDPAGRGATSQAGG